MTRMSYLDAGKQGLTEAMAADPNVWAVGEDLSATIYTVGKMTSSGSALDACWTTS